MPEMNAALAMLSLDLLAIAWTTAIVARATSLRQGAWVAVVLLAGLGVLHAGLSGRWLFPAEIAGPLFLAIVVGWVGLVGVAISLSPARGLVAGLGQRELMLLQGVRIFFGSGFLALTVFGVLPTGFGLSDGFTHVTAGTLGLLAAGSLGPGRAGRRLLWLANLFGLADILVVASTLSLILLPGLTPHHAMMYAVFLPAPLWLLAHLVSLWRLVRADAA